MATENFVIIINSAASTGITFAPSAAASLVAPVAPGTVLGTFTVAPAGWSGSIALSGTGAADFVLDEVSGVATLAVGATALVGGTYDLTATATP